MQPDFLSNLSALILTLAVLAVVLKRAKRLLARLGLAFVALAWIATSGAGLLALTSAAAQTTGSDPCPSGAPARSYSVSLINIPIVLNRFGDIVPEGKMFVLNKDIETVRATWMTAADPFNPRDLLEPLTIRANKGECVSVQFTNRLDEAPPPLVPQEDLLYELPGENLQATQSEVEDPVLTFDPALVPAASMHFRGLSYNVQTSDGTSAGNNSSSVARPGTTVSYRLYADQEGQFPFQDAADLTATSTGFLNGGASNAFGAFGAMVVEPPGSQWRDVVTGASVDSGTRASIIPANGRAYRENVMFMHDEVEAQPGLLTRFCPTPAPAPAVPDAPEALQEAPTEEIDPGSVAGDAAPDDPVDEGAIDPTVPDTSTDPGTEDTTTTDPGAEDTTTTDPGAGDTSTTDGTGDGAADGASTETTVVGDPPAAAGADEPQTNCQPPTPEQSYKLSEGAFFDGRGDALLHARDNIPGNEDPIKLSWFAFNYRSEPGFNRTEIGCERGQPKSNNATATCVGEETSLSSWAYGDPGGGDLVFHTYRQEATRIRLIHGGEAETHTFHWHVNRWPFEPNDEGGVAGVTDGNHHTDQSNPIDVQAVSPGSDYDIIPEGGSGSQHGSIGDVIFHCHLYPHFADGMWGLTRVHDKLENGTRTLPSGEPVLALQPLPGEPSPPAPTADKPGYPFFMPGEFRHKAPKPPLGVTERSQNGAFPPTALERDASFAANPEPGAFFVNPCPANAPRKRFEFSAIQMDASYNSRLDWHDPMHRQYVLNEHKQAVLNGTKKPEPFSPLLNVGDCVQWELTNSLPNQFGGTAFDRRQVTNEVSQHQHLVLFDVLASDGAANGWNYDQGADTGDTIKYQTYVQSDVPSNSFHDHFFPNVHQDSGLYGGSTVHPTGCTFHDPTTGAPVKIGTLVDIRCPGQSDDYRNFALFVADHTPLFQPPGSSSANDAQFTTPHGVPIFPPDIPSSHNDYGVMAGINYKVEPFEARRNADPSEMFSSRRWGDPETPQLRAYRGDKVKIDLFQLSGEHSHAFNLSRWNWRFEADDPDSNLVQAQHIGMLESFDLKLDVDLEDPNQDGLRSRDYLYNYGGADEWFNGNWGLMRVHSCKTPAGGFSPPPGLNPIYKVNTDPLQPLPDTQAGLLDCNLDTPGDFARTPGQPCPTDPATGLIQGNVRRYDVVAMSKDIVYNDAGDHDPYGMMYALAKDEAAIRAGTKKPTPLVIRAAEGDCVEVTLTNKLDTGKTAPHCFEGLEPGQLGWRDPDAGLPGGLTLAECLETPPNSRESVPGFLPMPVSDRVSMHPSMFNYQIGSDGGNVGLNWNSTVAPGGSITYRWFAEKEYGLALLQDRADVHHHIHHGAYGGLLVGPQGSNAYNPKTGGTLDSGEQGVVVHQQDGKQEAYRDAVLLFNSDITLFRHDGEPVPDNQDIAVEPSREMDDPTDQGEFAVNYRNEPFAYRLLGQGQGLPVTRMVADLAYTGTGDPTDPAIAALPAFDPNAEPVFDPLLEAPLENLDAGDPSDPVTIGVPDAAHGGEPLPGAIGAGVWRSDDRLAVELANLDLDRFPAGTPVHMKVTSKSGDVLLDDTPRIEEVVFEGGPPNHVTGQVFSEIRGGTGVPRYDKMIGATVEVGSPGAPCAPNACIHWKGKFAPIPPLPPLVGSADWEANRRFRIGLENIDLAKFPVGTLFHVSVANGALAPAFEADVPLQAGPSHLTPEGTTTGILDVVRFGPTPFGSQINGATVRIEGPCTDAGALCPMWQGQFARFASTATPANEPDLSKVFSSRTHGDPATPIIESYPGDNMRIWAGQAVGDDRSTTFTLHGHRWSRQPRDEGSPPSVTLQGLINPGIVFPVFLYPRQSGAILPSVGVGGATEQPGDYLYRSNSLKRHLLSGQWGLLRAYSAAEGQNKGLRTLSSFTRDTQAPVVVAPKQSIPATVMGTSAAPVKLDWSATDASGIASYELQRSNNGGAWTNVAITPATATTATLNLAPGSTLYRFRVRATDTAGNTSAWAEAGSFRVKARQESGAGITYAGTWTTGSLAGAYGGSVKYSTALGAKATLAFTGSHVALVSQQSANRGKADIWLDGAKVATIDLYTAATTPRKIVFTQSVSAGTHTLEVRPLGTKSAASTGKRVDVDAFVTLE